MSYPAQRGVILTSETEGIAPRWRLRRLVLGAVFIATVFWLWQWISTDETGAPIGQTSEEPSLEIEDLKSFLVRQNGLPLWQLNASRVSIDSKGTMTTATKLGRGILFQGGKPFLELSALRVRLSNITNNLDANGGVSASGPNDFSFQTSKALWIQRENRVDCPKPVTAWLRGLYFQTPRLSYQWDKGVLICPQPVEVRAKGAVLRGQRLQANLKTHQVRLGGGAELIFSPETAKVPGL